MTDCAVIWCSNNCVGECLIEMDDGDEFYCNEIRCCPMCDIILEEDLVLDISEEFETSVGDLIKDCGLEYAVDDPKAKTLVLKKFGERPGDWVAIRANPEDVDMLHVFSHVDGHLACEHVLPGQTKLDLGV